MILALPERRARGCDWSNDQSVVRMLRTALSGRDLATLTGADVRGYIAVRTGAGLSPGALNKELGLMSATTNWANRELEWGLPNPWQGRRLREPTGRTRYLTRDEAEALFVSADKRRDRYPWIADFCRLCVFTGLRSGEALGLEWSRVDLTARRISFFAADQKSRKRGAIPINESARAALLTRASYRAEHCPGSPWVFFRKDGSRVQSIRKGFDASAADAGLEDLHPHDLRRTFGSWLVQSGVGIERVSELLRHGDVRITAHVYAHLRPGDLAEAARVLDASPVQGFTPGFHAPGDNKKSAD
jgi:integrase